MTTASHVRELRTRGRLAEAVRACESQLARDPDDGETRHLLARLLLDEGRPRAALEALAGLGDDSGVLATTARALAAAGDPDRAIAAAERAVQLDPRSGRAQRALAHTLLRAGRGDEALAWLRRTVAEHQTHAGGIAALVELLLVYGDSEGARAQLRHLASVDTDFVPRVSQIAVRLAALGLTEAAELVLGEARALRLEDPEIAHLAAAAAGSEPQRASDAYVVQHFDRFAQAFDDRLARLGYRVPEELAALLAPCLQGTAAQRTILDAGCGTGLAGPHLRPLAGTLVGVDLSPGMLAEARARDCFDELHLAEVTSWWEAHPATYDAIVAADLFIYFGALAAPLDAVRRALVPGGCLAASFEDHEGEGAHALGRHGRWAHAVEATRRAAAAAGLDWHVSRETVLRHEAGEPVTGHMVVMRRAEGGSA